MMYEFVFMVISKMDCRFKTHCLELYVVCRCIFIIDYIFLPPIDINLYSKIWKDNKDIVEQIARTWCKAYCKAYVVDHYWLVLETG